MSTRFACSPAPTGCPWGNIEEAAEIAPGWWSVNTPSHGGFVLSPERLAAIPAAHLAASFGRQGERGFFEEDCDWCIVAEAFPDEWRAFVVDKLRQPDLVEIAPKMFKAWIAPKLRRNAQ